MALLWRASFWPPPMVYISVIITIILQITFLPDVDLLWAAFMFCCLSDLWVLFSWLLYFCFAMWSWISYFNYKYIHNAGLERLEFMIRKLLFFSATLLVILSIKSNYKSKKLHNYLCEYGPWVTKKCGIWIFAIFRSKRF